MEYKSIPNYSRYEINKDGLVRNKTTQYDMDQKKFKEDEEYIRLTHDNGKRDWVKLADIVKNVFKKEESVLEKLVEAKFSKSQLIWFYYSAKNMSAKEIVAQYPEYKLNHVYTTINDYKKTISKQEAVIDCMHEIIAHLEQKDKLQNTNVN